MGIFEIPPTKTAFHAEADIAATNPLMRWLTLVLRLYCDAEAVIAATHIVESAVRAVFLLKFDAQSMAVPCTDRIGTRQ